MFFKIGFLKSFINFTAKHLYWVLFLIKLQVFSSEICKIFKNTFLYRTPPVAASVWSWYKIINITIQNSGNKKGQIIRYVYITMPKILQSETFFRFYYTALIFSSVSICYLQSLRIYFLSLLIKDEQYQIL